MVLLLRSRVSINSLTMFRVVVCLLRHATPLAPTVRSRSRAACVSRPGRIVASACDQATKTSSDGAECVGIARRIPVWDGICREVDIFGTVKAMTCMSHGAGRLVESLGWRIRERHVMWIKLGQKLSVVGENLSNLGLLRVGRAILTLTELYHHLRMLIV